VASLATIAGLISILASVLLLDQRLAYPGWLALFPTIGSSLILWGGANSRVASVILSARAPVFVGLISYPLYLWHWPLLVFSAAFKFAPLTPLESGLVLMGSFVLAWLTYEFVEREFRGLRANDIKTASVGAGMMIVFVAGLVVVKGKGFETRFPKEIREFAKVRQYPASWRVGECLIDLTKVTMFGERCIEGTRPLIFVWGDSMAASLMPGLRLLQHELHFGLAQLTANSCAPLLSVNVSGSPRCRSSNDEILGIISRTHPEIVLLHCIGTTRPEDIAGLKATVLALRALSIPRIIVLGPPPLWKRGLPNEVLGYFVRDHALIPERSSQRVYRLWDDAQMRSALTEVGAEYISAWDAMCDTDGCLTRLGERPEDVTASDQAHLTESGSKFLIEAIRDEIAPIAAAR
jgi:hypothetical protein